MKNQVILVGQVESVRNVKRYAAGLSGFFTMRVENQLVNVNAWDAAAEYMQQNNIQAGDFLYVVGYLHAYKKQFENGSSSTRWTVKTQNIYKETAYVTLQGTVTSFAGDVLTLKTDLKDANDVVVMTHGINFGDRIITKGETVTVTGKPSFAGYSAISIIATSVY